MASCTHGDRSTDVKLPVTLAHSPDNMPHAVRSWLHKPPLLGMKHDTLTCAGPHGFDIHMQLTCDAPKWSPDISAESKEGPKRVGGEGQGDAYTCSIHLHLLRMLYTTFPVAVVVHFKYKQNSGQTETGAGRGRMYTVGPGEGRKAGGGL